jgi:hypothetical protein
MAGADQRGQKCFQAFWVYKSLYKNFVKLLVREIGQSKYLHLKTQHRTEGLIHNADENRKHLHSFQVVQHSMTAINGCSFGIGSPFSFRSDCCSDLSYLFS